MQTIFGLTKRIPNFVKMPYRREIFNLKDGGDLGLDFIGPAPSENNNKRTPLVIFLIPGLTSSSQTSYVKTLVMAIQEIGGEDVVICVFNNRGIGGVTLKTPRTHNAFNCEDIREVITHLKNLYPNNRRIAIGTSLGGVLLCHYLSTHPEEAKETFSAALVISTVWDMHAAIESMERPYINKYILNYGICQDVIYRVKKYKPILEQRDCWDFDKVFSSRTGKEFDSAFHVPQAGYKTVDEYYSRCRLGPEQIKRITVPVFALNALDDPMMPGSELPLEDALAPKSNLALIVTSRGGHLGFLEGFRAKPMHFVERFAQEFVQAVLAHGKELDNE
jgi:abhydrolase domain-containing protein 1/3